MIAFRSATPRKKARPRVPAGFRVYAVGDIHGRADLLEVLLGRIDADLMKNPIPRSIQVFLGDYIDRGPESRQVLDQLVARKTAHQTVFLRGNHEALLTEFILNPTILKDWQRLGGLETLMSYGIVPLLNPSPAGRIELAAALDQALTETHRQFLSDLELSFTFGDYFFVHAGVRPGIPLAKQREEDLLWIRQDFLHYENDFSKIIIHGHTPVPQPEMRANRINIDTGAYATGQLTCLVLEDDIARIL
jgi:diadenosine tetraphosphatase ApaH/serine/threonine PP2A family protein phosphatase